MPSLLRGSRYSAAPRSSIAARGCPAMSRSCWASASQVRGFEGCRCTACSNAARAATLRPALVSMTARSKSGSTESGLMSAAWRASLRAVPYFLASRSASAVFDVFWLRSGW